LRGQKSIGIGVLSIALVPERAVIGGTVPIAKRSKDCCAVCVTALNLVIAACASISDRQIPVNAPMPKIGYSQHNNGAVSIFSGIIPSSTERIASGLIDGAAPLKRDKNAAGSRPLAMLRMLLASALRCIVPGQISSSAKHSRMAYLKTKLFRGGVAHHGH
jgi:hypothetical protein